MAALTNFENVWGTANTWTLPASARTGGIPTTFTGEEALQIVIARSQGQPAVLTFAASWSDAATGVVSVTLSAGNSSLLEAGRTYQGQVICTPPHSDPICIGWFTLTSVPSPGSGGLLLRSLVELDEALDLLSGLNTQQQDMLGPALEAATKAIEARCRRILVLTTFDRVYRPGRTRKIYLDAWPVAQMLAPLSWGLDFAGTIQNTSTANTQAWVTMAPVSQYQLAVQSLTLHAINSGSVVSPLTFQLSSYPTFAELLAAISAAGNGWQAVAPNAAYAQWPTSRLNYQAGALGCTSQQAELQIYETDLWRYEIDTLKGTIELTQNFPEAYRYADRSFGIGFGWAWSGATEPRNSDVRAQYRAGYAITQSDIEAGFIPAPSHLKTACIMTANAILQATPLAGTVQSQSVNGRSYAMRSDASAIPKEALGLLAGEINYRFGGWGTR